MELRVLNYFLAIAREENFFIAVMFGLVFPFSQRLIVPTDTASALANSSCDSSAFLRIVFSRTLNGIRQHSPSR